MHTSPYSQSSFKSWDASGSSASESDQRDRQAELQNLRDQSVSLLKSSYSVFKDLMKVALMMIGGMAGSIMALIGTPLLMIAGACVTVLAVAGSISLFGQVLEFLSIAA